MGKNIEVGCRTLPPGNLPDPVGRFFTTRATWEAQMLLLLLSAFSRVRLCATP